VTSRCLSFGFVVPVFCYYYSRLILLLPLQDLNGMDDLFENLDISDGNDDDDDSDDDNDTPQ